MKKIDNLKMMCLIGYDPGHRNGKKNYIVLRPEEML